jgi:hypothetical protein
MILAAKFKSTAITTATEATAIAIEEISTGIANTNMEQHINKLIEATLKKQTSEKPKNSQGSKSPQTLLPRNKKQGKEKNKNNKQPPQKEAKVSPQEQKQKQWQRRKGKATKINRGAKRQNSPPNPSKPSKQGQKR